MKISGNRSTNWDYSGLHLTNCHMSNFTHSGRNMCKQVNLVRKTGSITSETNCDCWFVLIFKSHFWKACAACMHTADNFVSHFFCKAIERIFPLVEFFFNARNKYYHDISSIQQCNTRVSEWWKIWRRASHKTDSCQFASGKTPFNCGFPVYLGHFKCPITMVLASQISISGGLTPVLNTMSWRIFQIRCHTIGQVKSNKTSR